MPSYAPEVDVAAKRPTFNTAASSLFAGSVVPDGRKSIEGFEPELRTCGTTAGSATVTLTDTAGILVGSKVTGAGVSTARAVTIQDTGDTITLTAHGIPNGARVSFPTVVTTTGMSASTVYYVVGTATNTFQIATVRGGSALALTTNGTGTLVYETEVVGITANTNVTLDVPASATAAAALLMFRNAQLPLPS